MGTLGRAQWKASRQISMDCMIWGATSGNAVKIGTIQYNPEKVFRVLRGASWYDYDPERIFASFRRIHTPDRRGADAGFRCVLARESSR